MTIALRYPFQNKREKTAVDRIAAERLEHFARRCDRIFAVLVAIQWFGAIAAALWFTPRSWDGTQSHTHIHVYAAIFLGAILSVLPIGLALRMPGTLLTRQVIAIAQMLWSSLLIHVTGGRIETHFHVFGSLAFLAWYRDWRVLLTATLVTATDHAFRGVFWPTSVYGIIESNNWRTFEHAFWVIFEDLFLFIAMRSSLKELRENCEMQADAQLSYERIEAEVAAKTALLSAAKVCAETALRETMALQSTITTHAIVSVADARGCILEVNDAFCAISGYSRAELVGKDHRIVNSGVHPKAFWVAMWKKIASGEPWHGEVCNKARDGSLYWVDTMIAPFCGESGQIEKYVAIRHDITSRKAAQERLRASEAFLERVGQVAGVGGWQLDLTTMIATWTDQTCHIHEVPPGFKPTLQDAIAFYTPESRQLISGAVQTAIDRGTPWDLELSMVTAKGRSIFVRAVGEVEIVDGIPVRLVGAIQDITLRKRMENELRSAARTDKLTGLANRAFFADRLQQAVLRAKRVKSYFFAVLFLDFDRFKTVNDSLGHNIGDMLLQEIGRRLRESVRSGDSLALHANEHTTARLVGDEFVVLLDGIAEPSDAILVADRLLATLHQPYRLGDHEVYSTASIGIVTGDQESENADAVLRDADTAMYEAKLAGRGRYVMFDVTMRQRVQSRLNLENDLRKALDGDQLLLVYQPIVSLQTGEIESFEALVRWKHPHRGLVSPGEFIPIAEDTGLILPIGEWVLREACRQFAQWRRSMGDRAPGSISVNLSRRQLLLPDLPETIREILRVTGVPPACLHLEITESAVMKDATASIGILESIKAIGVKLDMDDFGTGYSSLACLHQFPIDVLKIDRSFIANIDRGRDFVALVHAVAQLARNLNIRVVAEGIETVDQAVVLQSLECELGQGYLFAKPLRADQVPTFRVPHGVLPGIGVMV